MKAGQLALKIREFIADPPIISLPLPGDRDHGDANPPVPSPILILNPSDGREETEGVYVVVPGSEIRIDSVPHSPMLIEAWISDTWMRHSGVNPDSLGGFRDHATGGGYSVNVSAYVRIECRRIGRYWFLSASTRCVFPSVAASLASERDVSGYYDRAAYRFVRANEYGDYRQFEEPTRADRYTDLMGRSLH